MVFASSAGSDRSSSSRLRSGLASRNIDRYPRSTVNGLRSSCATRLRNAAAFLLDVAGFSSHSKVALGLACLDVLLGIERRKVRAQDLVLLVSLDPPGAFVPARDAAAGVEEEDRVVLDAFDQMPESLRCGHLVGHLPVDLEDPAGRTVERPFALDHEDSAVLAGLDEAALPGAVPHHHGVRRGSGPGIACLKQLGRDLPQRLLGGISVHSLGSRVPVSDPVSVRINREHRVETEVEQPGRLVFPSFGSHVQNITEVRAGVAGQGPARALRPRRILFIEDDRFIADMYRLGLEAGGWTVDIAHDGESGVSQALADPPALILLDLLLPRMDGFEVLRRLRSNASTQDIPVLVISNASGLGGREEEARNLGIVDWMVKANTTPATLVRRVERVLATD